MTVHLDLHCHSFFSDDGVSDPLELIDHARRKGLVGLALTDHNTCEGVDYLRDRGWIRDDGEPVDGFLILPGVEVSTADGHLLCLGAELPNMKGAPAAEVVAEIHRRNGLAIPPHPYDLFRAGIRESVLDVLEIDALEVFNAATTLRRHNDKALAYATRRGLPMTASSDAHHADVVGTAYTILDVPVLNVRAVLDAVTHSPRTATRYLSMADSLRKTFANLFRPCRRPKAAAAAQ